MSLARSRPFLPLSHDGAMGWIVADASGDRLACDTDHGLCASGGLRSPRVQDGQSSEGQRERRYVQRMT